MALTIGQERSARGLELRRITLDNSYPNTGSTIGYPNPFTVCVPLGGSALYTIVQDSVTGNLRAYLRTTGVEAANAANLSAESFWALCQ